MNCRDNKFDTPPTIDCNRTLLCQTHALYKYSPRTIDCNRTLLFSAKPAHSTILCVFHSMSSLDDVAVHLQPPSPLSTPASEWPMPCVWTMQRCRCSSLLPTAATLLTVTSSITCRFLHTNLFSNINWILSHIRGVSFAKWHAYSLLTD